MAAGQYLNMGKVKMSVFLLKFKILLFTFDEGALGNQTAEENQY